MKWGASNGPPMPPARRAPAKPWRSASVLVTCDVIASLGWNCRALWFCFEDCPLPGASACEACCEKIRLSPETPRRVIPLARGDQVLDRLTEHAAERLRQRLRQRPPLF